MLEEERQQQLADSKTRKTISSTLDPLLERIARDFVDNADLSSRLQNLFKVNRLYAYTSTSSWLFNSLWDIILYQLITEHSNTLSSPLQF